MRADHVSSYGYPRKTTPFLDGLAEQGALFEEAGVWTGKPAASAEDLDRTLAAQARQRRPALKVLFMTGYSRNAIVHQGRLDPGVELIQKPLTSEQLAAAVRKMLDS